LLAYLDAAIDICQYQMPITYCSFSSLNSSLIANHRSVDIGTASVVFIACVVWLVDWAACTPNANAIHMRLHSPFCQKIHQAHGSFGTHDLPQAPYIRAWDHWISNRKIQSHGVPRLQYDLMYSASDVEVRGFARRPYFNYNGAQRLQSGLSRILFSAQRVRAIQHSA
jgi:hypothetical protein